MDYQPQAILSPRDKDEVCALWNAEYPKILQYKSTEDFTNYLSDLDEVRHYVWRENEQIKAWAMSFERKGERWFALILAREKQGCGWGHAVMERLKAEEKILNGWVIDRGAHARTDGTIYPSPLEFYRKNGFEALPVRWESEQLSTIKIRWVAATSP